MWHLFKHVLALWKHLLSYSIFNVCIDYVLNINISNFVDHIYEISLHELEIKATPESNISVSSLDIPISVDVNGHLTTSLHDECNDVNFHIYLPSLSWVATFCLLLHMAVLSQLTRYTRSSSKLVVFVIHVRARGLA